MSHEVRIDRFDKFTEPARKAILWSKEEAENLSHHETGTEHLLLGVVRQVSSVFGAVLNIDLDQLRTEVKARFRPHNPLVVPSGALTDGGKNAINLAVFAAADREEKFIAISHLVSGLARVGQLEGFRQELGTDLLNKLCHEGNMTPKDLLEIIRQQYR